MASLDPFWKPRSDRVATSTPHSAPPITSMSLRTWKAAAPANGAEVQKALCSPVHAGNIVETRPDTLAEQYLNVQHHTVSLLLSCHVIQYHVTPIVSHHIMSYMD